MRFRYLIFIFLFLLNSRTVLANPNQFGSSGLLHVPSADTLDSANFCFGVWGNCSEKSNTGLTSIMPVTLTLGIGTFWEVYGTYPNAYPNSAETPYSGRGTADVGSKIRFYGARSSKIKLAADLKMSRYVDDNPIYNGVSDVGGRLIASLKNDYIGVHLYSGFMSNGNSREVVNGTKSTREFPLGTGVEFFTSQRSKVTLEATAADAAELSKAPVEAALGFQYYLTPHLTFNLSGGAGLNSVAPDWRFLIGLSTCQGVGAYIKPVPVVTRKGDKGKPEVTRPTKIVALSPLLIKTPALTAPASKFEVPLDTNGDEMLVRPYGNVVIPQQTAVAKLAKPPIEEPQSAGAAEPLPVIIPPVKEDSPEYTLTRVTGVTPLYGVSLKGENQGVTPVEKTANTPVTAYRKFRLPDNLFEFDNADMIPEVQKSVSELAEFIRKDDKWVFIRIDGHTDAVGSVKYNMDLSLKRAVSVANYLITKEGIDPARIFVRGMGKSAPIADNSTDEGRKLNRRFEIVFLVHKENKK
jgi:outer membrane protein OmpA-like peptidoglycan-associated protein